MVIRFALPDHQTFDPAQPSREPGMARCETAEERRHRLFRRAWARLRPYLSPVRGGVILGVCLTLFGAALTFPSLYLTGQATQLLQDGSATGGHQSRFHLLIVGSVGLLLLRQVIWLARDYIFSRSTEDLQHLLRSDLIARITELSPAFYETRNTGAVMSQVLRDSWSVTFFLMGLVVMPVTDVITLAACSAYGIWLNWQLFMLLLCAVPIQTLIMRAANPKIEAYAARSRQDFQDISSRLQETVSGIQEIQLCGGAARERARFDELSKRFREHNVHGGFWRGAAGGALLLFGADGPLLMTASAVVMAVSGSFRFEEYVQFGMLMGMLYGPIGRFIDLNTTWRAARPSLGVILDFLEVENPVRQAPDAKPLAEPVRGHIALHDLVFGYHPNVPVLHGISVTVRAGEHVGIAGPSGSGKSTLTRLITRMFDPTAGRIEIDGQDLRNVTLSGLRSRIAVVSQCPVLFSGSIRENICLGRPDADDDEVRAAAEAANLHREIMNPHRFPLGYDTDVGERGRRLSDGQKQRLAVARAFLRDAPILIIDEATASQDARNERLLQDSITRLMAGKTCLVVAHRLTTLTTMDRVLVLNQGRLEEEGPHEELIRRPGLYQSLWRELTRSSRPTDLRPVAEPADSSEALLCAAGRESGV